MSAGQGLLTRTLLVPPSVKYAVRGQHPEDLVPGNGRGHDGDVDEVVGVRQPLAPENIGGHGAADAAGTQGLARGVARRPVRQQDVDNEGALLRERERQRDVPGPHDGADAAGRAAGADPLPSHLDRVGGVVRGGDDEKNIQGADGRFEGWKN